MLKLKETKAITLIALIVTIVVLLILAGVTIVNVTGGDGIIEQASEQRDKTKISAEEQILGNAVISASDKFGEITENNLRQSLSNQNVEITKSGGLYRIVFKDTNNLYKMNKDGEFFYWENMAPTEIYWRFSDNTLYLRSSEKNENGITYTNKDTLNWNSSGSGVDLSRIYQVIIEEPIAPTTCEDMFIECINLQDIENIKNLHTENVTSLRNMFYNCNSLNNLDLSYFDTSNVLSMFRTFCHCDSLDNINLSNWDTSNTTTMYGMFQLSPNLLRINLDNFNTKKVSSMNAMFYGCTSLESLDISCFNIQSLSDTRYMFRYCSNLKKIYSSNSFILNNTVNSDQMFLGCINIKGGNGTKCSNSYNTELINGTYARVDTAETPGYFTLKEN